MDHIIPALRSLAVPIASVNPDPSNARRHPEKNLAAIVASLNRFGQRAPIVVQRQGMVVRAGNGRLEAAKSLGWKHIAAVIVDESSTDATAFAIADNGTSDLAEWDDETLASLLQSLPADMRDVAGFDEKDLGELLNRLTPEVVEALLDAAGRAARETDDRRNAPLACFVAGLALGRRGESVTADTVAGFVT